MMSGRDALAQHLHDSLAGAPREAVAAAVHGRRGGRARHLLEQLVQRGVRDALGTTFDCHRGNLSFANSSQGSRCPRAHAVTASAGRYWISADSAALAASRPRVGDGRLVEFGLGGQFLVGACEPRADGCVVLGSSADQAPLELLRARWGEEHEHTLGHRRPDLARTLQFDLQQDRTGPKVLFDRLTGSAIGVAGEACPLKQPAVIGHVREVISRDEEVLTAVLLPGPRCPGGGRHRQPDGRSVHAADARRPWTLPTPLGPGDHVQPVHRLSNPVSTATCFSPRPRRRRAADTPRPASSRATTWMAQPRASTATPREPAVPRPPRRCAPIPRTTCQPSSPPRNCSLTWHDICSLFRNCLGGGRRPLLRGQGRGLLGP